MSRPNRILTTWYPFVFVLLAGALFLLPAFYNGYPLVNADDGSYIQSGFSLEFPNDRPITYGLLIRLLSLNGVTLWGIIVAQALAVAALLWQCSAWCAARYRAAWYLGLCLFLTFATPLASVLSQVLPDAFCPVMVLATVVLASRTDRPGPWWLYGLIFLSAAVHISHLAILFPALAGAWLAARALAGKTVGRIIRRRMLGALGAGFLALPILAIPIQRSGPAFTVGALLDEGILMPWLREHCGQEQYSLCASLETMPPNSIEFLWNPASPFNQHGGFVGTREEYGRMVSRMNRDPAVLRARLQHGVRNGFEQLLHFDMGDGMTPFPRGTYLFSVIGDHIGGESDVYADSRQNRSVVNAYDKLEGVNHLWRWFVGICAGLWLLTLPLLWRRLPLQVRWHQVILPVFALSNALVCGMFSAIVHRYGARAMWVFPLLVGLNIGCMLLRRNPQTA